MKRYFPVYGLVLWAIATYGILQIQAIEGEITHDLCGVWGCYPPLQALIAWHGFLMMLALPLLTGMIYALQRTGLRRLGILLVVAALMGLGAIVVQELINWYPKVSEENQKYLLNRLLFVAVQRDIPLIQTFLSAIICLMASLLKPNLPPAPKKEASSGSGLGVSVGMASHSVPLKKGRHCDDSDIHTGQEL